VNTLIVNPNPIFDRTITVVELVPGAVIRTRGVELTAGGKGINVARVLRALGRPARMVIPVGVDDRARYESLLVGEGAEFTAVDVPGGVRTASIYLEERSNRVTVVNDAGTEMAMLDWERVRDAVRGSVGSGDLVLCMGSFPPGLPASALGDLIDDVHAAGGRILVDSAPQWLAACLTHRPDIVTPNLDEAEAALEGEAAHVMDSGDQSVETVRPRAERAALALCDRGAAHALVTSGSAGVAVADASGVTWEPAYPVKSVSTVGAGDSFVAGLAFALAQAGDEGGDDVWGHADWGRADWGRADWGQADWGQAVRFGVAAAAASCELVRAGGAKADRIREILADLEEHHRTDSPTRPARRHVAAGTAAS
jgi:1-phosphofructokinase family hexose kinase